MTQPAISDQVFGQNPEPPQYRDGGVITASYGDGSPPPPAYGPGAVQPPAPYPPRPEDAGVVVDAEKTGKSKMITVKLVGKSYLVRVPKTAWALKLAVRARQAEQAPDLMATAMDEWIARVFSAEDAADVMRRLYDDPDDELDIDHIMALMEKMLDRAGSPNPTS